MPHFPKAKIRVVLIDLNQHHTEVVKRIVEDLHLELISDPADAFRLLFTQHSQT